jgi:predicted ATPase/class 3 adenylate cyclase
MRDCGKCGARLGAEERQCPSCGAPASWNCRACGAEISATARFCSDCGVEVRATPAGGNRSWSDADGKDARATAVERRQATILFCDLVGFTQLSGQLDPEDLRDVLHAFRDVARAVVRRHEGFIGSYMGDGILVFFAYPRAHEDDSARAVRAALEIVAAVAKLEPKPGLRLRARAGIATGLAIIGQLLGEEMSRDEAVVGQVANLAARLQSAASPDTVIVSAETHRLMGTQFDCVPIGPFVLKGFEEVVPAWRALRERQDARLSTPGLSVHLGQGPLVGREREMTTLRACWEMARAGQGQLVLVRGEPGIGKTRLSLALRDELGGQAHLMLPYLCSQRFQNTEFAPVTRQIEHAARIGTLDAPGERLDKLESWLRDVVPAEEVAEQARQMAVLLSIPFSGRYPPIIDSPELQKQHTLGCLRAQLRTLARRAPLLVLVEDLHWADPSSLELVVSVVKEMADWPILVVATARPEVSMPWPQLPHVTTIDLDRLGVEDATRIVRHLAGEARMPVPLFEQIVGRGEGVPLFIEELTKTVLETGVLDEAPKPGGSASRPSLTLPSTLQASLMARLDRLSAVKEVAQVASAIGREFPYELLKLVMSLPDADLRLALDKLVDADLLTVRHREQGRYAFRHALIQEAAYSMMLRSTRQQLHRRIAETLEAGGPGFGGAEPESLALHWREAGDAARAINYLDRAGTRAAARAANAEAQGHFSAALELVGQLPPAHRPDVELDLLVKLGLATSAARGYAAPEVESIYRRALAICRELRDTVEHFPVIRGLATFYIVRAELDTARELSEQCLRIGEESQRPEQQIEGHTAVGYASLYQGDIAGGELHLARAVELYESSAGETLSYPTPQDPAVASLSLQAVAAWLRGDGRTATRCRDRALALAARLGDPFNGAYVNSFAAMLENVRGDFPTAARYAMQSLQLAQQHGFGVWVGAATLHHAIAIGLSSDPATGAATLEHVISIWQAGGAELNISLFLTGHARCLQQLGNLPAALAAADRARDHARSHGECFLEAEIHRTRAEIRHALDPRGDWRGELAEAIAIARRQGAASLELRAIRALLDRIDFARDSEGASLTARLDELAGAIVEATPATA